jgi:hypothetical protein
MYVADQEELVQLQGKIVYGGMINILKVNGLIDCLRSMTMRLFHNPRVVAIRIRHSISEAA